MEKIGPECFSGCDELEKVEIGNKITYIPDESFKSTKIKAVDLSGTNVEELGGHALMDATGWK